jgi:phospholipid N-methyltransferase
MRQLLRNCGNFLREVRRDFKHTGAVLPSSPFLGRAMAAALRGERPSARILEVGPGTGSVTVELLRYLQPGDQLDLVEINSRFVELLDRRRQHDSHFQPHRDHVQIIHAPVQSIEGMGIYDFIVSSLPLNNFSSDLVREVFQVFERLLVPGGTLTFFEYAWVRHLKSPFAPRLERRRLFRVGRILSYYVKRYQYQRERIYANVPPAIVRHLRLKPAAALSLNAT